MAMCHRLRAEPPTARVMRTDAEHLPFADEVADVVVASHMLYHVPDQERALAEIRRVLRPSGRVIISTNGRHHMREIRDLVRAAGLEDPAFDSMHESFTFEDAPERVRVWFPDVEVVSFDDGLVVPDAEPLVRYIGSYRPLTAEARDRLSSLIDDRLRAGPLSVTKSGGVLIGRC
jgi:SAM-dependent methyltransferase